MSDPLDIEQPDALQAYLKVHGHVDRDEALEIRVLAGGVSNRTVWVKRPSGETWVVKQALEKLRVKADWFSSPERIHREALGLRWLAGLAPSGTVPKLVFEDHDEHIVAMQAIPEPHDNWKTLLLAGKLDLVHVRQFAYWLGYVDRHGFEGRDQVEEAFGDSTFFESLRIEPYYAYTAEQVPQAADFLHDLIHETRATRLTLVHGDYSPKNVLVYQDRLILLDFEVINFGDPAFDLGFSMTHLLSKAHHVVKMRADFAEATNVYWNCYREILGNVKWASDLEARAVRNTLGCLLARVAGKSPLEYLSTEERAKQREVVLALMQTAPKTVADLVDCFVDRL